MDWRRSPAVTERMFPEAPLFERVILRSHGRTQRIEPEAGVGTDNAAAGDSRLGTCTVLYFHNVASYTRSIYLDDVRPVRI